MKLKSFLLVLSLFFSACASGPNALEKWVSDNATAFQSQIDVVKKANDAFRGKKFTPFEMNKNVKAPLLFCHSGHVDWLVSAVDPVTSSSSSQICSMGSGMALGEYISLTKLVFKKTYASAAIAEMDHDGAEAHLEDVNKIWGWFKAVDAYVFAEEGIYSAPMASAISLSYTPGSYSVRLQVFDAKSGEYLGFKDVTVQNAQSVQFSGGAQGEQNLLNTLTRELSTAFGMKLRTVLSGQN